MNNFELQNEYYRECAQNNLRNIPNYEYTIWLEKKVIELRGERNTSDESAFIILGIGITCAVIIGVLLFILLATSL